MNLSHKLSCYKPSVTHIDVTSFNSIVIVFLAVSVLWGFVAEWTETFLYALLRHRCDSLYNALLMQLYLLLWKHVPTIHHPTAVSSMLPQECAQQSPTQQMGRLQLSSVMSHYRSFFSLSVKWRNSHIKTMHSCGDISKTWPDICSKLWLVCRLLNYPSAWIVPTQLIFSPLPLMSMILQSGRVKLDVLLNIKIVHHKNWFLSVIWTNSMKIYWRWLSYH